MREDIQSIKREFGILGNSPQLNRAIQVAVEVAQTDMSVLVTGESGVGKEVFSKIIHKNSARKHNKYIAVNCGAIPEGTIESELFGHVKGAFTNADRDRKGYFAEADKGTIFLDEVGELPMNMQVKLLRVLESGEFIPVGSSKTLHCDVRIVAATNVNLLSAIEEGRFREDLYYRLNQISISIPPLRERQDDIYLLFKFFAVNQAEKYHMPHISLTADAREYLKRYTWKGNVRQLKNVAEQISIVEQSREINTQTLMRYIPMESALTLVKDSNASSDFNKDELFMTIMQSKRDIENLKNEVGQLKEALMVLMGNIRNTDSILPPPSTEPNNNSSVITHNNTKDNDIEIIELEDENRPQTLGEIEKEAIERAYKKNNTIKAAAEELGVSERTLYRKIIEYDLDRKKS
ncbi:MAG: sigma-54-dependent Fis family transcriptional regulator [Bacteroidales bacterium]|nr:sigma-54-dependent Fis family transcriptional regulator [Bacteroidales bacterium]